MRSGTVLSASLALAMLACTSGEATTEPTSSPSLTRTAGRTYTGGVSLASVDADVLCSKPGGLVFAREHCKANEHQLDPVALGLAPRVIFRDVQRQALVSPGEELIVAVGCENGEVVISGGYSTDPADPLRVTLNAPFFDGQHSGWRVDFLNVKDMAATLSARVTVSCMQGTGVGE
jgi:hypothetical protein